MWEEMEQTPEELDPDKLSNIAAEGVYEDE